MVIEKKTTSNRPSVGGGGDGGRSPFELESLARVDMKTMSQSELYSLSRSSSSAFDLSSSENLVIPNIESDSRSTGLISTTTATPRRIFAFSHRRGSLRRISASQNDDVDPQLTENRLILNYLEKFVTNGDANTSNPRGEGGIQKRNRKSKSNNDEEFEGLGVINLNGEAIDLRFLARVADGAFEAELNRMTEGMVREDEFLGFLQGLEGRWGSSRKRRKYVDASNFVKALPIHWKILLSLRPRVRRPSLYCRRFVSPSGEHFNSCKDVAFYMKSKFVTNDANPPEERAMMQIQNECQANLESVARVPRWSTPASKNKLSGTNDSHNAKQKSVVNKEVDMVQDPVTSRNEQRFYDLKNNSEEKIKLKTRCMWCHVEFFRESVDAETLASSSGFICPKCKENVSSRFENSLSKLIHHNDA